MEKRIIDCQLDLNNQIAKNPLKRQKSLGAVLEMYDKKNITDILKKSKIKFVTKVKRHNSIEMMFQKKLAEQINLADDDIF